MKYLCNKPLISIHIPKCGGTSFSEVLKKWFGERLYKHYFDEKKNIRPGRHELKKGMFRRVFKEGICIHGHFNKERQIGVMDYYPEVDQFITILRDPFEIAISNYFYVKKMGENSFRNGKPCRLDEHYKSINEYMKNRKSYLLNFMPYEMTMDSYKDVIEKYFVYIGIVEDLQTSINILAERLSFSPIQVNRLNISGRSEAILNDIKEEFMENNKLEYAIYNYALRIYKD